LDNIVKRLEQLLLPAFEDLEQKLVVGVVDSIGKYQLISSGPLPEAVAASEVVHVMFSPVSIPGNPDGPFNYGGMKYRVGLDEWRKHFRASETKPPLAVVHLIRRSSVFSEKDSVVYPQSRRAFVMKSR